MTSRLEKIIISSSGCYFLGHTLVHTPNCSCSEDTDNVIGEAQ